MADYMINPQRAGNNQVALNGFCHQPSWLANTDRLLSMVRYSQRAHHREKSPLFGIEEFPAFCGRDASFILTKTSKMGLLGLKGIPFLWLWCYFCNVSFCSDLNLIICCFFNWLKHNTLSQLTFQL